MKKLLVPMIAMIILSGCAGLFAPIQNPVNRNQLYGIEASYGLYLSLAVAYRSLPPCAKNQPFSFYNVCAKRPVIVKLQEADHKAQIAIDQANTFVKEYPTLNAAQVIQAAANAVMAFNQVESENHIY